MHALQLPGFEVHCALEMHTWPQLCAGEQKKPTHCEHDGLVTHSELLWQICPHLAGCLQRF